MAEFNFSEIVVKAGDQAVSDAKDEAVAATERAIKRIANPPKKSLPAPTLQKAKAKPAPSWFKYGLYALAGLAVFKLVSD